MRLAIAADWLVTFGGAEHTIAEFLRVWPGSPLYTTVARRERLGPLADADIRTTRLQPLYEAVRRHQLLLPLMPRALEDVDLSGYDVILSSSHAVGKGIVPPPGARHVCYCHTPMRYAWEMEEQYLADFRVPKLLRGAVRERLRALRRWDLSTAKRVDTFIANSTETQDRILRIYGRDSLVVHPPADDRFFDVPLEPRSKRGPFLAIGRLVPYKRFDLLIALANREKIPLQIAGTGQEEARLKAMAGPTVRFLGFVPDAELPSLYAASDALLFPPLEDAGIVPLEAQACGTPVIAFRRGGSKDAVADGVTGVFFDEQTVDSLAAAVRTFRTLAFDPQAIRDHARKFSGERFRTRMKEIVENTLA
jgi:glycosyltransferase involved in cell wall biosynthesis